MPPEEARAVLASGNRVRLSERTLVDMDALMDRLAAVRTQGYATADGENAYGLRTTAHLSAALHKTKPGAEPARQSA